MLMPLIISAPFGNYIQPEGATATLGTFTLEPRPGRLWATLTRIRAYPSMGGYVNKIGLRNPGIASLADKYLGGKIVSIHGFDNEDWVDLIDALHYYRPEAVELNFSCPNVVDKAINYYAVIQYAARLNGSGNVIVKLPPIDYEPMVGAALSAGVSFFHCCNTLPMPNGGMSGRPLKRYSIRVVQQLRKRYGQDITIIGGGGVFNAQDVRDYFDEGVDHVAVGSSLLNPLRALMVGRLAASAAAIKCRVEVGKLAKELAPLVSSQTCS